MVLGSRGEIFIGIIRFVLFAFGIDSSFAIVRVVIIFSVKALISWLVSITGAKALNVFL